MYVLRHLDREVEDLFAVLEAAGEPAHLLGHSYGAVVAYLAATRGAPVRSCVLYEPPLHAHRIPAGPLDQIAADIERGDRTSALRRFYLEVAGATTAEVALLERLPGVWKQLQETVRSLPREVNAVRELGWRPGNLPFSDAPVLLLNGEVTDALAFATVEELCRFIPAADAAQLPGQGHLAMVFAPWTLAALAKAHFDRH